MRQMLLLCDSEGEHPSVHHVDFSALQIIMSAQYQSWDCVVFKASAMSARQSSMIPGIYFYLI